MNTSGQGSREKRPREDIRRLGVKSKCSFYLSHSSAAHSCRGDKAICVRGVMGTAGCLWNSVCDAFGQEGVGKTGSKVEKE